MNNNGRSVIDRLQSIEDSLNHSEKSISEQIDEDFVEYLNNSTIYYYENDERKFNNFIKKRKFTILKYLILIFMLLVINIIYSICTNEVIIFLYINISLYLFEVIYYYIFLKRQTHKKLSFSAFNIRNTIFYDLNNSLKIEKSVGIIYKILIIFKVIVIIFSLLCSLFVIVKFNNSFALALINLMFIPIYSRMFKNEEYTYNYYIFEKNDSYIVTDLILWKKYTK